MVRMIPSEPPPRSTLSEPSPPRGVRPGREAAVRPGRFRVDIAEDERCREGLLSGSAEREIEEGEQAGQSLASREIALSQNQTGAHRATSAK